MGGLAPRLFLGLLLGSALLLGVHAWVAAAGRDAAAASAALESPERLDLPERPASAGLLGTLPRRGAVCLLLARDRRALPPRAGPVLAIASDGRLRLVAPPPRAEGPEDRWLAAAVLLPTTDLAQLAPAPRATLLEVVVALLGDLPVAADQLMPCGVHAPRAAREALLRWLR